jgi:hypothetical protein
MTEVIDPVRQYLQSRGCAPDLVERGLDGLLDEWQLVAEDAAELGYPLGLDDYLNDMDGRDLLEGALQSLDRPARAAARARLEAADRLLLGATLPCAECLWGEELAEAHHWEAGTQWWYYRVPKEHSLQFAGDLEAAGIHPQPE